MARVIAVVSAKGGVGKSSICAGLGKAFSDKGHKVLLVDTDIALRSLDILLNVGDRAVFDWSDVIRGNCTLDKALLNINDRLALLCAPSCDYSEIDSEKYCELIDKASKSFDIVILDASAGLDKGFSLCVSAADEALVVATPDGVSVRAASIAAERARESGIEYCRLIINRFTRKNSCCTIDQVIDGTSVRLIGVVPEDKEILLAPSGHQAGGFSRSASAFKKISGRLLGENIPLRIKGK